MGLPGVAIGTYHPLSAIRYHDVNPLPTRYTLFITLIWTLKYLQQLLQPDAYSQLLL
jgi:hypothetical protein